MFYVLLPLTLALSILYRRKKVHLAPFAQSALGRSLSNHIIEIQCMLSTNKLQQVSPYNARHENTVYINVGSSTSNFRPCKQIHCIGRYRSRYMQLWNVENLCSKPWITLPCVWEGTNFECVHDQIDMCIFFFIFSDGWTTADLVFLWKDGDPVQVVKNLHLPRFTLEKFRTDYCNSKTNTGEFQRCARLISNCFC